MLSPDTKNHRSSGVDITEGYVQGGMMRRMLGEVGAVMSWLLVTKARRAFGMSLIAMGLGLVAAAALVFMNGSERPGATLICAGLLQLWLIPASLVIALGTTAQSSWRVPALACLSCVLSGVGCFLAWAAWSSLTRAGAVTGDGAVGALILLVICAWVTFGTIAYSLFAWRILRDRLRRYQQNA